MKKLKILFFALLSLTMLGSCGVSEVKIPPITANCFIVKPGGSVVVPINNVNVFWNTGGDGAIATEMGNTWSEPNLEAPAVIANIISDDTYVAEVIWCDIAEGVNVTFVKTATDFTVSGIPDTLGNIVVGVKRAGATEYDNYLWSWHLWVTDFNPEIGAVTLPSGLVAMDRNLGATNAIAGDEGAYGLYYQWGRKDPFPGSNFLSVAAQLTNEEDGTLLKVVGNPSVFYYADAINMGFLSGDKGYNRWGGSLRQTVLSSIKNTKSIYDPCPEGWRMPWGTDWSGLTDSTLTLHPDGWDNKPGGIYTDPNGKIIWFPAAGYRHYTSGSLNLVGTFGFCWSGSPYSETRGYSLFFLSGHVSPSWSSYRSEGFSVRPVQDN